VWFADSAATVHVSSSCEDFTTYRTYTESWSIKAFGNNSVKGIGEGDIMADIEFQGKITHICLTQVMHIPGAQGKILFLKLLDQKGFKCQISGGRIQIMKNEKTYTEVKLGGELYEVSMKIVHPQDQAQVLAAVKRDMSATDLHTWHRRLGHLGNTMLKSLVNSSAVKGMDIMNSHLEGICEDCIMGKMDEKPFSIRTERNSQIFGMLHVDLMGPMNPEARWSHAKFSLVINDYNSGFGFVFNM